MNKKILVVLILIFALFLRLYRLEARTSFDADQEWLASRSLEVKNGDIALIGPVTSVGYFSIGPGFVYMWSAFSYLSQGDPISGALLSVFLGVTTILVIFLFVYKFVDTKTAYLSLFLLSISSTLIVWDQSPWTPSLFYLSQTIVLYGAYLSIKKDWGFSILAIGLILGFQSHLGIVISLISIIAFFIIVHPVRVSRKMLSISIIIVILGLLPNFVYDASHEFNNLNRLGAAMTDEQSQHLSFNKIFNVLAYNTSSILYPRNVNFFDFVFIKLIFVLVIGNCIYQLRSEKFKNLSILLLTTIFIPSVLFYLKQGKFSEYYLMMTVPSLIISFIMFVKTIINKKIIVALIVFFSLYLNGVAWRNSDRRWSLKDKMDVSKYMMSVAGSENYGISLTTKFGEQFGFGYIFKYLGINAEIPPKNGEGRIFTVVIPTGFDGITEMRDFNGIGLIWRGF